MSTPLAGPLAGAARVRPDGWLATALTTDPDQAEAQARSLIYRHHPAAPGPVRCLTARYRTATFTLGAPPRQLLKRHGDEAAYLGEVLAYQLLEGEQVLPELHSSSDTCRTLMVDFLEEIADIDHEDGFEELIAAVAAIHTAPARWPEHIAQTMSPWRLASTTASPVPAWIRDPAAWQDLLQLTASAHGEGHVPLGHLDLKADHCRRRPDGRLALVDAETLRPDLTGLPDLITLAYLGQVEGRTLAPRWARQAYRRHTNDLGAQWTDAGLVRALTAFATATGLTSLHGVDQ
ncbi:hypothetical protein AQI95_28650 [Streptomyces yokosukanensis]|uniref:Aminoglycoside phosphotransferase domain-containing protein n=1 Tax=Streptomyces yokosukanensis TaxID=67386 RepID=A0A117Q0I2_9ACTN|nr:hypothetical protein [Streptomyces yokosukanensis]KUN02054.1 hypothetical protein AQI95_28650 [Streptomyces yokosukanensis]